MSINRYKLFNSLLNNFLECNSEVEALIVSDRGGLIIAGEKRKDINMEIVSVLTAIINPILERIRNEFAFKKFGTASFDTDEYRLLFISIDEVNTLSVVIDPMASIDKISPYAYFLAEKSAQIINAEEDDHIQLTIPNFEYEGESHERLKSQIYQMRLESGGIYRFKFIIIGDHEVGKTSIVRRYVDNKFSHDYRATIGLSLQSYTFKFLENEINISLWDIGAQDFFRRMRKTYYAGSQAAFIVFDLTNRESFKNIENWYDELSNFLGKREIPIVIIGNKLDLVEQRKISYNEGIELINKIHKDKSFKISYLETSALTGENINDAFNLITYHYLMREREKEEKELNKQILKKINIILGERNKLELSFVNKSQFWSPALQIISEINELGENKIIKDEKQEKIIHYNNNLKVKNLNYDCLNISDSDGILIIFDIRNKLKIVEEWRKLIIDIIDKSKENSVVLIGLRIDKDDEWSKFLEDVNINEFLEKKVLSLLFFKLGEEYRLEIYDQLIIMLSTIEEVKN